MVYWNYQQDEDYKIESYKLAYVVIMTQDCDLESDYKSRQKMNQKNDQLDIIIGDKKRTNKIKIKNQIMINIYI